MAVVDSFRCNEAVDVHTVNGEAGAVHCCSLAEAVGQRRSSQVEGDMSQAVVVRTCRGDMEHEDVGSKAKARRRDEAEACALDLAVLPMDCNSEALCCTVAEEEPAHIQAIPSVLV